ncbi:long-chain-fatty-acid--CoA ligase [Geomicrobium sediminis]|uniref:Fatty-acyl-CoA synthase n=1 Tax=Geomicrobium sediminis TaxID=1347788 RepID=A0ABS2PG11_9BACL|nr:fatty-acyl-CoA synthase [Geomicrobium sediminis]
MTEMILTDFLDRAVRVYGEKKAIIDQNDQAYTYTEINDRVNQLSHGLSALGIQKGDRVAYLAPNTLEMFEGFYGMFQVGAIMVSLNTRLKSDDYLYILNHSESKALFVDHELYDLIAPILPKLETVQSVVVHGAERSSGSYFAYDSWLQSQESAPYSRADLSENDLCSILYTSGTTGKPKGVMLTHRSNYLHALSTMHHLQVTDQDTLLHVLPMFHVNGWGSPFYYTANGATQVMQKKTDPSEILERMERYDVSVMHMAPTVLGSLIDQYKAEKRNITQDVRVVIAGAAPPQAFVKTLEEEIGFTFIQVYGMTESSPLSLISYLSSEDDDLVGDRYYEAKAKQGFEMIGSKVRVINDEGKSVPTDGKTVGELVVKGHGVMKGYWKNDEETARTIRDGWLYTGDMATVDDRHRVQVVDRKKDIIISGGENISSIEVESVFYDHSSVKEAAIVAKPDEKWGETPHAILVLREGHQATEQEMIDYARSKLAHFKCPRYVTFMDELPKTASGKIQKVYLRDLV